jgi:DNA-binding response OmpR family regulator
LLADRDLTALESYGACLRLAAYDVMQCHDGREALALAISRLPQVVVTEIQLPGLDGYRLCELLRRDEATRQIPIIVVGDGLKPSDVAWAERVGADLVLSKPCLPPTLLAAVQSCVARSRALRQRAAVVHARVEAQLSRAARELEPRGIRTPRPLSKMFNRHSTVNPPIPPPSLVCPTCDTPLDYQYSHVGGVSELHKEQWDYLECPLHCGKFQYRHRTRRLRKVE